MSRTIFSLHHICEIYVSLVFIVIFNLPKNFHFAGINWSVLKEWVPKFNPDSENDQSEKGSFGKHLSLLVCWLVDLR